MQPDRSTPTQTPGAQDLRAAVERLGVALADLLGEVLGELSERTLGTNELAARLETSPATASKLLRAISKSNPLKVVQGLPGPLPLRGLVERAREQGARAPTARRALDEIAAYAELVRRAGDIKSFEAMLSGWLPDERRAFEVSRRQSVFRALSDLEGANCRLQLNTIVLVPQEDGPGIDLVGITGLFGVRRVRPDARVALATMRLPVDVDTEGAADRRPLSLDRMPLDADTRANRLDEFCMARPAPLVPLQTGDFVQYTLGPTDIGKTAEFDLLMAEFNRRAGSTRVVGSHSYLPFFSTLPQFPARVLVFDLIVHREVYADARAELQVYAPGGRGLANPNDPARVVDRREALEELTEVDAGLRELRMADYPKYPALLRHVLGKLDHDANDFRAYRLKLQYPLPTVQWMTVFRPLS